MRGDAGFVAFFRLTIAVLFLVGIFQLFRWQVLKHNYFKALASAQIFQKKYIFTKRGTIYTSDGIVLASDKPSWNVVVSLVNQTDKKKFLATEHFLRFRRFMVDKLGVPSEKVDSLLYRSDLSYVVLKKGITKQQKEELDKQHFIGVYTFNVNERIYPNNSLASHVVGFVGKDSLGRSRGVYGIEGFFWGDIKGKRGLTRREKDLKGDAILSSVYKNVVFREGKNIVLTLRAGLERKVERVLERKVKEYGAKRGTVIIMDPKTGEILVMATYPRYDPNKYWMYKDPAIFKNPAVSEVYEYGSVQKPLIIAMALQEKKITEDFVCNDTGRLKVIDKVIYNWAHRAYGKLKPKDILRHSDNVCAAQIGLKLGAKTISSYLHRLGIGRMLGVGLQDEETAFLKPYKEWNKVDVAVSSFGQMVSATPLQVISAISTLANHGKRMQPFLVKEIYNSEERSVFEPVVADQVFSREVADKVVSMMEYATMSHPIWWRYKKRYSIAGKTGTAQIPKKNGVGYEEDKVNATFVAFAPAKDPVFIMLVKLEEPKKYKLASLTAVPTWQAIFDEIKDDLGVPSR